MGDQYGKLIYIKFNSDNTGYIKNKTIYPDYPVYNFKWEINEE